MNRFTSASNVSGGAARSTSPAERAFAAESAAPSRIIRRARRSPTARGSRCVPPHPGISPSITSGSPSFVCPSSRATRCRQASANSSPPPRQGPWIAATVGNGSRSTRSNSS